MVDKIKKPDAEWRKALSPEQFHVTREKGTERAFSGEYYKTKTPGMYKCVCCGSDLFASGDKFESGTGWPSYTKPAAEGADLASRSRAALSRPRASRPSPKLRP